MGPWGYQKKSTVGLIEVMGPWGYPKKSTVDLVEVMGWSISLYVFSYSQ